MENNRSEIKSSFAELHECYTILEKAIPCVNMSNVYVLVKDGESRDQQVKCYNCSGRYEVYMIDFCFLKGKFVLSALFEVAIKINL